MKTYKQILISVIVFSFFSCGNRDNDAPKEPSSINNNLIHLTEKQFQNIKIEVGGWTNKSLKTEILLKGMLDVPPQNIVHITPPYGGYLKHTSIMVGSKVKKGETLAILEHPDYIQLQQDFLDANAKLDLASTELERQKQLAKEHLNANKNLQQAQTEYQIIRNQKEALIQKLSLINISAQDLLKANKISKSVRLISPITGCVQAVNANIGKYVQPADVLFQIVNTDHMHIALSALEKDVNLLYIGQKIKFYLPNTDTRLRTGSIHLIGRSLESDKTLPIHAHIDKNDAKLVPGMFVNAVAEINTAQGKTIPTIALIDEGNRAYVFEQISLLEYRIIPIKILVRDGEYCQIQFEGVAPRQGKIVFIGTNALYYRFKAQEE